LVPTYKYHTNSMNSLENESIEIIRESVAQSRNPVMLYSIGKDSSVLLHLLRKAFHPAPPPLPLLHIDTKWKFKEMYQYRDRVISKTGVQFIGYTNKKGLEDGIGPFSHGSAVHTEIMKTTALRQALDEYKFDVVIGGARRDEEKSRAKERIVSYRSSQHGWDPKNQRAELWSLYNFQIRKGESIRVFPLSNWTEFDIWKYIAEEQIDVVPLYYAKERPVIRREGQLIMVDDSRINLQPEEKIETVKVRFRTLGCWPLTAAIESDAESIEEVILELQSTKLSERNGRLIDSDSLCSMEKKKREGYF